MYGIGFFELVILILMGVLVLGVPLAIIALVVVVALRRSSGPDSYRPTPEEHPVAAEKASGGADKA